MKQKKKILVLSDWFEPGYKAGGPIRSVSNLVHRMGNDFDFFVLTSDRDFGAKRAYDNIPLEQWLKKDNFRVKYVPVSWMSSPNLLIEITELEIDIVYMNSLFSKQFTLIPLLALKKWKGIKVLAPRGMLGKGSLQVKSVKKKMFLTLAKQFRLFKNIHWHATNIKEKEEIELVFGQSEISVVSNLGRMPSFDFEDKKIKQKGVLEIVFFARISPIKNLSFCFDVLQKTKSDGKIVFNVIGPIEDESYWKICLEQKLPNHVILNYLGEMNPKDLGRSLKEFDLLFLPTKNENFGHSIVEAWSYGIPVLISDRTPWLGISKARVGADLPLDKKEPFIQFIDRFVEMDSEEYKEISNNAIQYAYKIIENQKTIVGYKKMFGLVAEEV